ncbi:MAG: MBL fold metallo-hydrolase [Myxococcota bacterium]
MTPFVYVLGVAQDGGHPQAGCTRPCCRGLAPGNGHLPSSLALVDPESQERWLLDATPAFPEQLRRLDAVAPRAEGRPVLDGVLLTHAHMGHYTGLMFLGREVLGARDVPLYLMPRLAGFLRDNGPWSQLVALGNVRLVPGAEVRLNARLAATALVVPHRDEYSETVAWRIQGPTGAVLYLPDIDRWDQWALPLEHVLATVDAAWIDGTFWTDGELGRDMHEVPHPRIADTLARLAALPAAERAKVRFTHLNHTNPVLDPTSPEAEAVTRAGCHVAVEGERFGL